MSRVQVDPVTSNTTKLCVFESRIEIKGAQGKAMTDQIMTADKQRLENRIGKVSPSEMPAPFAPPPLRLGATPAQSARSARADSAWADAPSAPTRARSRP